MADRRIVCLGEVLFELVPQTGGGNLWEVPSFTRNAGGAPANVAFCVGKLGCQARFIGKIGNDPFGSYVQSLFRQHGVEAALVQTDEAKTGVTFVSLMENGERDFVFCNEPSADILLQRDELEEAWIADAGFFHFGSRSLMRDDCRLATVAAAKRARELGAIVSFDPNIRLPLWSSSGMARQTIGEHLPLADIVKVSGEELEFLLPGADALDAAHSMLEQGVAVVVISLGADGCRVITRHGDSFVSGFSVQAVDTTGAGDGFVGGLLYQLHARRIERTQLAAAFMDSDTVKAIFRFANAVGALTAARYGAVSALPDYDEVIELLRSKA